MNASPRIGVACQTLPLQRGMPDALPTPPLPSVCLSSRPQPLYLPLPADSGCFLSGSEWGFLFWVVCIFCRERDGFSQRSTSVSRPIPHTHPVHSETMEANPLPATSHLSCPPFSSMDPRPQENCQLSPCSSSSLHPAVPKPPSQAHKIFGLDQQSLDSPSLIKEM